MTIEQSRNIDSLVMAIASLGGGAAFGVWLHSLPAGIFAVVAIGVVGNIGWAIEYRGVGYEVEIIDKKAGKR